MAKKKFKKVIETKEMGNTWHFLLGLGLGTALGSLSALGDPWMSMIPFLIAGGIYVIGCILYYLGMRKVYWEEIEK